MGRTINQFRRLRRPSTQSLSSIEGFEPTYSSIISINDNQDNDALDEIPDDGDEFFDEDEDNLRCKIHLNTDNYRLCKTKAVHDTILGKIHASLTKKTLTATEAPHLDTKI